MEPTPKRPCLLCRLLPGKRPLTPADRLLAQWIGLTLATLLPLVLLMVSGHLIPLEDAQLRLIAGHPFYLGAEEAQISLLGPVGTFCLCTLITLWLAGTLLREPQLARRTQIAALTAVAITLPGLMCVLWGGVLYIIAPLTCVALLWGYLVPLAALLRPLRRQPATTPHEST